MLSVKQMGTVIQGGKLAHRRTMLTDLNVKGLREQTGQGLVARRRSQSAGGFERAAWVMWKGKRRQSVLIGGQ